MNVQAFINNISFPSTLDELEYFADQFNVEEILTADETEWTAPKWVVPGDIVFFFHAKTAISRITKLETELRHEKGSLPEEEHEWLWNALQRARVLYKNYGGKIFALGRISGQSTYDLQEGDEIFHWRSRFYAPIDRLYVLEHPLDISEFSDFIFLSRQSAITPVIGNDFKRLKKIIMKNNEVPNYLRTSQAIPLPLQKINEDNWLDITHEYRRRFTLEMQFRKFYVDYFLRVLGQQKKFFAECACYREGQRTGYADNSIKLGGKWCFVEVKLNVHTEPHLHEQLKKYCYAEQAKLNNDRTLNQEQIWQRVILVIDTAEFYYYNRSNNRLTSIEKLDNILVKDDIQSLQKKILSILN